MDTGLNISSLITSGFMKWLGAGILITAILAYVVTSPVFVKPMYESEAIIYVPLTLFSQQFDQQGIGFGNNIEIDGHIQILRSSRLLDSLDSRFGFAKLWDIPIWDSGGRSRLYKKIQSRIDISKTRYSSVSVSVRDHDSERAAQMANAIVEFGDVIKEEILLENRLSAYQFSKELFEQKQAEILVLEERMELINDEKESLTPASDSFRQRILYEAELWELTARKNQYEKLRKSLNTSLPRSYIVSSAIASHSSVWPPRLLIAAGAVFFYFLIAVFIQILRKDDAAA